MIAGFGGKIGDLSEYPNETPDEAMDRESDEEIGVKIVEKRKMGKVRFIFYQKSPDSNWNQEMRIYAITKW